MSKHKHSKKRFGTILLHALTIGIIAIILDYLVHLTLTAPMETISYFLTKFVVFFIFSVIFLSIIRKLTILKIVIGGIIVASIWGFYYNILPVLFDYTPYGIPLSELSFLGTGLILTGLFFGITHTLGFIIGGLTIKLTKWRT